MTTLEIEKAKTKLLNDIQQIENEIKQQQFDLLKTLQASFRREIVNMGYDLEEIGVNRLVKRKKLISKVASKARKEILDFPES